MGIKVAINGYGRIGRQVLRAISTTIRFKTNSKSSPSTPAAALKPTPI